jgi:histone-lysine N-methyltransferase SUV39H
VRWDDWARPDGTKTTWNTPDSINSYHWRKRQQNLRSGLAKKALDINIISTTDIHNTETYLRSQAYREKLRRSTAKQRNLMLELTQLQAKHQEYADGPAILSHSQGSSVSSYPLRDNQRASTRQKTEISLANSSSSSSHRGSFRLSTPSSVTLNSARLSSPSFSMSTAPSSASAFSQRIYRPPPVVSTTPSDDAQCSRSKGKQLSSLPHKESDSSPLSSSSTNNVQPNHLPVCKWRVKRIFKSDTEDELQTSPAHHKSDVVPAKRPKLSNEVSAQEALYVASFLFLRYWFFIPCFRRSQLQSAWTTIAAREKAAPIYFSNTVDNVATPDLSTEFRYLESSYEL